MDVPSSDSLGRQTRVLPSPPKVPDFSNLSPCAQPLPTPRFPRPPTPRLPRSPSHPRPLVSDHRTASYLPVLLWFPQLSLKTLSRPRPLHLALTLRPGPVGMEGFLGAPLLPPPHCPGTISARPLFLRPQPGLFRSRLPGHEACPSVSARVARATPRPGLLHDTW